MTNADQLQRYLTDTKQQIENALREAIPKAWNVPDKLREAMEYSLYAGGKRLRPILVIAAAQSVSGDSSAASRALPFAAAVEMIHTYSLIHDDLPAIDNDDFRRGRPTSHRIFGEAMAILAGDGLLTHAFYTAAQAQHSGVKPERALAVVGELARFAGLPGMVGGQADDIMGEQGVTTLAQLESIHLRKTSELIAFSLRAGGHASDADDRQLTAFERFGRNVGLAFQIQDDILDVTGDEAKLGKPVMSDEKQLKVTFPYLIGLDESRKRVANLTQEAKEAIEHAGLADPGILMKIADYIMSRDH